ncbi:MAG: hypothetical protein ACC661_06285, partial [Verrucomicrobiales bacterium]
MPEFFRYRLGRIDYARWEWIVMRLAFAWFVLRPGAGISVGQPVQPIPRGLAQFFDFTWIVANPAHDILTVGFYILIGLYALGFFPLLSTAGLLAIHTLNGTLINSQGAIHHTTQIVGFVLIGQLVAHLITAVKARRTELAPHEISELRARECIYLSQQLAVAAYVATGISKMVARGGTWVQQLPNIALQFVKTREMDYYNTLVEAPAETGNLALTLIMDYPGLAQVILGFGLLLELFAFLALFNRPLMAAFGISLILMHQLISEIMSLGFVFN